MNNNEAKSAILRCEGLNKTYTEGPSDVEVLKDINLTISSGDKVAIVGASGSGKSTLLHLLGGLDLPSSGDVWVDDKKMSSLSDKQRGEFRNQNLGFIYQFHHLLPEFTAIENVAMPLLIRGVKTQDAMTQATDLLKSIGLSHRLEHRPVELSGGERQRAAIARALVTKPKCVLADEPTGNLDSKTAETVFDIMLELNDKIGTALVMVTHDQSLAQRMDESYKLLDGQFV